MTVDIQADSTVSPQRNIYFQCLCPINMLFMAILCIMMVMMIMVLRRGRGLPASKMDASC